MSVLGQDLRHGVRALRRQPGFTIVSVITFALAIGTTTAIFAALYGIVLRPLPFDDPDRLAILWRSDVAHDHPVAEVSYYHFREWQRRTRTFDRLAAIGSVNWSLLWSRPNGEQMRVKTAAVSASFFPTVGASPALGRAFLPEDDQQNSPRVVILSDGFWARQFGRNPSIVGRTLTMNDQPVTVVGVMPAGFEFPRDAEAWSPVTSMLGALSAQFKVDALEAPGFGVLYVVGRLKAGVAVPQAKQDLDRVVRELQQVEGKRLPGGESVTGAVTPLTDYIFGNTRPILFGLAGTGAIVLLIACANIAGLLLVRALAARRDSAVRLALGASRAQMMRLWLSESLLLAGAGLVGGLLLARWGSRGLAALAPAGTPRLDQVGLNVPVLLFATTVCVLAAIACGLVPAWLASRPALRESLADGGRQGEGHARRRARHVLVVAQLGMAMMLLVAAGLMFRSVVNLRQLDLGYEPANLLTLNVETSKKDQTQVRMFYEEALTRIRALPQVEKAGGMNLLPLVLGPIGMDSTLMLEGQSFEARDWMKNPIVNKQCVTSDYFEAMGTRLIRGRTFTAQDTENAPLVLVVGESAARRLWPGQEAVGKTLQLPGGPRNAQGGFQWQTVVGVVADGRFRGIDDVRLDVYAPHRQNSDNIQSLLVRTTMDPVSAVAAVRSIVLDLDPRALIGQVQPMETIVQDATASWRFGMMLFTVLSIVAFALAVTGLSGLISYTVAQRHREIALRLALGALPGQVRGMIVRQGAVLVAGGLALGLVGAFALSRALSSLLFGVSPADLPTFAIVMLIVAAVALVACYLAAHRTTRINAMTLLR